MASHSLFCWSPTLNGLLVGAFSCSGLPKLKPFEECESLDLKVVAL
ncbi:hypothetical protein SOVF_167780 [Spinacia oleracea]|nr:hypothetical protein SOVF_167780 [Spinacia oleracea]